MAHLFVKNLFVWSNYLSFSLSVLCYVFLNKLIFLMFKDYVCRNGVQIQCKVINVKLSKNNSHMFVMLGRTRSITEPLKTWDLRRCCVLRPYVGAVDLIPFNFRAIFRNVVGFAEFRERTNDTWLTENACKKCFCERAKIELYLPKTSKSNLFWQRVQTSKQQMLISLTVSKKIENF